LQLPIDRDFTNMVDKDCKVRAQRVAAELSREAGGLYTPSDLSVPLATESKWAAIDKAVEAGRGAVIDGPAGHVGGIESMYQFSFHVIVFLAVEKQQKPSKRRYYLGFNPDVGAAAESRAKWKSPVAAGGTEAMAQGLNGAQSVELINAMILGDSQDGFGPLVRKYYIQTDKAFPKKAYA